MKHALFGASGTIGKSLAPLLAAANTPFRAVGRSLDRLRRDFAAYEPLVDFSAADLNNPESAAAAAAGVGTLFYLVGAPYMHFDQHPKLTRIALGTVYPYGKPERDRVDESHPRNPGTFKGRMRKEQEDLVFAADGRSGMRTTILRAPDFFGPSSELSYVWSIFQAALKGGVANVIGPIDTPHEFIYVPDVAAALLALSEKDEARLRAANKTMLRIMGIFSPFMREVAEMHYLWTTPVVLDDTRLRRLLPGLRRTSYEDGIQSTLSLLKASRSS
jgi:nucleoside-diphosphate-sugar epimerase